MHFLAGKNEPFCVRWIPHNYLLWMVITLDITRKAHIVFVNITALQTVRKAMTHIYYVTENEGLRLSLWAFRAGSSFSVPKSAVASFPHCL